MEIYNNDIVLKKIGKLNKDVIYSKCEDSLFYIFPLIEKIVREIYLLFPTHHIKNFYFNADETITKLIQDNNDILSNDIIDVIKKYYEGDDALRNLLFNPSKDLNGDVDYDELIELIENLLNVYVNSFSTENYNR